MAELITEKQGIMNNDTLVAVKTTNTQTGEEKEMPFQGLFVAIGHSPTTSLFTDFLSLDDKGYIKTLGQSAKTEIDGVFACGDVQDSYYRQAITASGSGCMAAIDAERYLEGKGL